MIDGWEFQTKTATVVPFSPGQIVYVDGMLSTLFYETQKAGRLETVFCGDLPNHDQFIRMFAPEKKVAQVLCEIRGDSTVKPVGYCWVEMPKGEDGERAAMCGFAFFRPSREMFNLGRIGIAYWMKFLKINVVHGVMLESNFLALKYAVKLGFTISAEVPRYHFHKGKLEGARAVTLQDVDFLPNYERWYEQNRVANE